MLLTITTETPEAADLGYLLQKHPDRLYERDLGFGVARVFFPEAGPDRCTVVMAVEVDAIALARGSLRDEGYVTDRPYVAGSLMCVAIGRTFNTAIGGRAKDRSERVGEVMPVEATLSAVHAPGGEGVIRRAFEPLGYSVTCEWGAVGEGVADQGESAVGSVRIVGRQTIRDLLRHLFILIPVVDGSKHYYVGSAEVEKLIRHGEGWLADHDHRDWVVGRYLRYRRALTRQAIDRLMVEAVEADEVAEAEEQSLEKPARLNDQRLVAVHEALGEPGTKVESVADVGCGEGRLLKRLALDARFNRILGLDVSSNALKWAADRIDRLNLPQARRSRVTLGLGSVVYRDDRLVGFDAAVLVEVIEHIDPSRLPAFESSLFAHARPARVVITTPNAEYNATWATLPAGRFRHRDHRFEWTRAEFEGWSSGVAERRGYRVAFRTIGPVDPVLGSPTQMALFDRIGDR